MHFLFEPVEPRRRFAERPQDPGQRVWAFRVLLHLAEITREIRVFVRRQQRVRKILDRVKGGGRHEPNDNARGVSRREGVPPMLDCARTPVRPSGFAGRGFSFRSTRLEATIVKVRPERNSAIQA